ncbi:MAG: DUF11 domain-containing protein [Actinobacteria bacterium]|nr:MAG: DUF11 domain-containing protein [Actinomycetota bacterium]
MIHMRRFVACLLACAALAVVVAGSALADPGDSADLGVSVKADAKSYTVGDLVTYTLTVTNYGEATADSVKLVDLLPAGLELVSVDASSSTSSTVAAGDLVVDPNDTTSDTAAAARIAEGAKMDLGYDVSSSGGETLVTVPLDSLSSLTYSSASDAMRTITIVARETASGTTTNVASVDSANPDQNEAGNNFAVSSVAIAA